jgi:hypothetical protein
MKASTLGLFFFLLSVPGALAQQKKATSSTMNNTNSEQELITLSREKWRWMAEKKADTLAALFHEKSMFVHMGGSWGKEQEIKVIRSGEIWYKKADVHEVSVQLIGNTAILLNRITLQAVVGGNEVVNPFSHRSVYRRDGQMDVRLPIVHPANHSVGIDGAKQATC